MIIEWVCAVRKANLTDPETRFNEMLARLKAGDFRITPQRLAVLRILATSENHPSVEQIFRQVKTRFPTTSLATVYKTVTLLKDLNQVLELGFPVGSNRYDGNKPTPHPHLICIRCEMILDPDLESLTGMTHELISDTGFRIVNHRLDFFGICPACQKKKK
jgi:Fur family peroxide stress response transcriptional regulator